MSEKEKKVLRALAFAVVEELKMKHPMLVSFESNFVHFAINNIIKETGNKWDLTYGWFHHGPYFYHLDDVLVEMGMDPKYHQLKGSDPTNLMKKTLGEHGLVKRIVKNTEKRLVRD